MTATRTIGSSRHGALGAWSVATARLSPPPEFAFTLALPRALGRAIGVGAYLKTSIAVVDGASVHVTPVLGNLDGAAARIAHAAALDACLDAFPDAAAIGHDLHPDFPSTQAAQASGLPCIPVQHHHAHVLATAAENGWLAPVLGLALDGFGLGPGGESWGGELLLVDGAEMRHLGGLAPLPQPGGDAAALAPWRMAAGVLHALGRSGEIATRFADQPRADRIANLLDAGVNCPRTSSAGRLFDATAALCGLTPVVAFEGEAPMALERLVETPRPMRDGWCLTPDGQLDLSPVLASLTPDDPKGGAERFHGTLIDGLAGLVEHALTQAPRAPRAIALTGGCFFNAVLREGLSGRLADMGLRVLMAGRAGPGDTCIAIGQAVAAALTIQSRSETE